MHLVRLHVQRRKEHKHFEQHMHVRVRRPPLPSCDHHFHPRRISAKIRWDHFRVRRMPRARAAVARFVSVVTPQLIILAIEIQILLQAPYDQTNQRVVLCVRLEFSGLIPRAMDCHPNHCRDGCRGITIAMTIRPTFILVPLNKSCS